MTAWLVSVRALAFGVAAASVSALGHAAGGGSTVSVERWALLVVLATALACPLLVRERRLAWILAVLGLAQVGLHLASSIGSSHVAHATGTPSLRMVGAHALLLLATAWWLRRGEALLWAKARRSALALAQLLRPRRRHRRAPRTLVTAGPRFVVGTGITAPRPIVDQMSRRGPPVRHVRATAFTTTGGPHASQADRAGRGRGGLCRRRNDDGLEQLDERRALGGTVYTPRHIARIGALLAVGSILVMGPTAGQALAHTGVLATSPKAGSTLSKAPRKVTITFTEEIRDGSIIVRTAGGTIVSKGTGGKDPANVRRLRVSLKSGLGKGTYKVRWTVEAADGHKQAGSFTFKVR